MPDAVGVIIMQKLLQVLMSVVLMLTANYVLDLPLIGVSSAYATPAIPVHYDSIADGEREVAMFGLMGVKIDRQEERKSSGDTLSYVRLGHIAPNVNKVQLQLVAELPQAAEGSLHIRAYRKCGEDSQELESMFKSAKAEANEKLNLGTTYALPDGAQNLIVEFAYSYISSTGHTCNHKAVYYLEIV